MDEGEGEAAVVEMQNTAGALRTHVKRREEGREGEGRGGEGRGGREGGGEVGGKEKNKRRGGYLFRKDSTGVQAVPTLRSTRVEVVVHRYLLKISPSIGDLMPEIT